MMRVIQPGRRNFEIEISHAREAVATLNAELEALHWDYITTHVRIDWNRPEYETERERLRTASSTATAALAAEMDRLSSIERDRDGAAG